MLYTRIQSRMHTLAPAIRVLILLKLLKATCALGLALWITLAEVSAEHLLARILHALLDRHGIWHTAGAWAQSRFNLSMLTQIERIAWIDGTITALQAILLYLDKPWGGWLVAGALALPLPFELHALIEQHALSRLGVLTLNTAIVVYLVHYLRHRARPSPP